jgi:hypothetical protein
MNDEIETTGLFEADLESLAIHEMSHFHVAISFGIPARVKMQVTDDGWLRSGFCEREFEGRKFEAACIGWAGVMGEHLLNRVHSQRTPLLFPLTEATIVKWYWEAMFFLNELSDGDRQHIVGHADTLETCQHAFRILTKRIHEIEADAKLLTAHTRKEVAAKLAAVHEAKELAQRLESELRPVLINGVPQIPVSIAGRAKILSDYLEGRPDNDPEKIRLAPMLDSLRRGIEPNE